MSLLIISGLQGFAEFFFPKDVLIIIQRRILQLIDLKRVRNFDVGRLFCQMVTNYSNIIENDEIRNFFNSIRTYIQSRKGESFFLLEDPEEKKVKIDLGLFSMVFWSNSLLQDEETLQFVKTNWKQIETVYLLAKNHQWENTKSIKRKNFSRNLDTEFKDIAMNQIVGGLIYLTELHSGLDEKMRECLRNYLIELRKSDYFKIFVNKPDAVVKEDDIENSESYFEKRIHFLLMKLFPEDNITYHHPIDIFLVDFFIEKRKIIVECDGKHHFVLGKKKLNDIKKEEVLKKRGYKVVSVHIDDWNRIPVQDQLNFLKEITMK